MASVYEIVTEKIMAELEKGIIPWQKPWTSEAPKNLSSGKAYRGINLFLLAAAGYGSPYWLTYKQAAERGGNVRKGQHGTLIVFWKFDNVTRKSESEDSDEGSTTTGGRRAPILRYYTVFNVEQCEGIDAPAPRPAVPSIEAAETIAAGYPNGPRMEQSDKAAYSPSADVVYMPARNSFHAAEGFYSTLFHELAHSTGHTSRLNRFEGKVSAFGSEDYSKEELVAEMTAAMLCGSCGIDRTIENSGAYLRSWLKALKADSRMVVLAAAQAQKAADWIQGKTAAEFLPAAPAAVSSPAAIAALSLPVSDPDATGENVPFAGASMDSDATGENVPYAGEYSRNAA